MSKTTKNDESCNQVTITKLTVNRTTNSVHIQGSA